MYRPTAKSRKGKGKREEKKTENRKSVKNPYIPTVTVASIAARTKTADVVIICIVVVVARYVGCDVMNAQLLKLLKLRFGHLLQVALQRRHNDLQ